MVTNKHKVPQELWKKFKESGQKVFNDVMEQSLKNQSITTHPKMPDVDITKEHWKTICWNFSCYAAWAVSKNPLKKGDEVVDIDTKSGLRVKTRKVA